MPYKYYFGKTGRVWNVTKRALGIEMLKTVGNRKRTNAFTFEWSIFAIQSAVRNSS